VAQPGSDSGLVKSLEVGSGKWNFY